MSSRIVFDKSRNIPIIKNYDLYNCTKLSTILERTFFSTQTATDSRKALTDTSCIKPLKLAYYCHDYAKRKSNKPPLITLHGMVGSKNNLFSTSNGIHETTGIKVFDVDARNHGDSEHSEEIGYIHMAHDFRNLIEELKLSKVSIIGHSLGGRTAMAVALLWPELIHSIVVVDILPLKTNPRIFAMDGLFDAMMGVAFNPEMSMSEARELADEQIKKVTLDINIRKFLLDNLFQTNTGAFTWRSNISAIKKAFKTDFATLPPGFSGLKYPGPALFTAGSASGFISQSDMPEIYNFFPSAKVTYFEGAGHWLHTQMPEQFREVVSKFLIEN